MARGFRIGFQTAVRVAGEPATYAVAGFDALLKRGWRLFADFGTYAITGQPANFVSKDTTPIQVNLAGQEYFDESPFFIDLVTMGYGLTLIASDTSAPVGSDGWPRIANSEVGTQLLANQSAGGSVQIEIAGLGAAASVALRAPQVGDALVNNGWNSTTKKQSLTFSWTAGRTRNRIILTISGAQRVDGTPGYAGIRIPRKGYTIADLDAGRQFTDEFLASIARVRVLRMMDWHFINGDPTFGQGVDFSKRPTPTNRRTALSYGEDPTGTTAKKLGHALETMCALANLTGKDLWINLPVFATDTYVAQVANFLHANLTGGQRVYVEWVNELWNTFAGYVHFDVLRNLVSTELNGYCDNSARFSGRNTRFIVSATRTAGVATLTLSVPHTYTVGRTLRFNSIGGPGIATANVSAVPAANQVSFPLAGADGALAINGNSYVYDAQTTSNLINGAPTNMLETPMIYAIRRCKEIGEVFRSVVGDANMRTRYIPVFAWQSDGTEFERELRWLKLNYPAQDPGYYVMACAHAPYFSLDGTEVGLTRNLANDTDPTLTVADYTTTLNATAKFAKRRYGYEEKAAACVHYSTIANPIELLCYEGGPDTSNLGGSLPNGSPNNVKKSQSQIDPNFQIGMTEFYRDCMRFGTNNTVPSQFQHGEGNPFSDFQVDRWWTSDNLGNTARPKIAAMFQVANETRPIQPRLRGPGTFDARLRAGIYEDIFPTLLSTGGFPWLITADINFNTQSLTYLWDETATVATARTVSVVYTCNFASWLMHIDINGTRVAASQALSASPADLTTEKTLGPFSFTSRPGKNSIRLVRAGGGAGRDGQIRRFTIADPVIVSGTSLATLVLSSAVAATRPWTFGHVFRAGDVPAGSSLNGLQTNVVTTWPDGSAKFALVSGTATLPSASVSLRTGAALTGSALTTANLRAALTQPVTIATAANGSASWSGTDWDAPIYQIASGPLMSSWVFRKAIGVDANLCGWLEVRLYSTGAVEVLPWVENGTITSAPSNKLDTYTFTMGGTQRFSASIDVKGRTRVPLLTGAGVFSYWLNPAWDSIVPRHDTAYMMATGMVPNYGWGAPSTAKLNSLPTGYAPNTLAGVNSSMGAAGSSASLIPEWQVLYVTSNGDARAYRAAMVFGLSGGTWSTHYRDGSTQHVAKFADIPNTSLQGDAVTPPDIIGGAHGSAVTTHQPAYGYLPHMISGWYWFWEESAFWSVYNYLSSTVAGRQGTPSFASPTHMFPSGSAGVIDGRGGAYANRGAHWSIRTLAQTFALCSPTHPTFASWKFAWECNTQYYRAIYVDGTFASGQWVSPLGILGEYIQDLSGIYPVGNDTGSLWGAGWMNNFGIQAWGFSSDLGLPQSSTSLANHLVVRNNAYKAITFRAEDGQNGRFNWRRIGVFAWPLGTAPWTGTWYTPEQTATHYLAFGLSSIPGTLGLTLKDHTSEVDTVAGSSTASDYGAFALSALAYAVKHGAPGASAGWTRVSSASNFLSAYSALNDNAGHGITPPVPAWLGSANTFQWVQVTANKPSSVQPNPLPPGIGGPSAVIDAWGGAALRSLGSYYILHGGGHGDYSGNEIYALKLSDDFPTWQRRWGPTPTAQVVADQEYYSDGNPASAHTYAHLLYDDASDKFRRMIGGKYVTSGMTGAIDAWSWDAANWDPAGTYPHHPVGMTSGSGICMDPATGDVYCWANANRSKWSKASNTFTFTTIFSGIQQLEGACAFDPVRNCIWSIGGYVTTAGQIKKWSLPDNGQSLVTVTGNAAAITEGNNGLGIAYAPGLDKFFLYTGTGTVYVFDPVALTINVQAMTGTPPGTNASYGNGTAVWGRLQYVPALRGIVYIPAWNAPTFFFRVA